MNVSDVRSSLTGQDVQELVKNGESLQTIITQIVNLRLVPAHAGSSTTSPLAAEVVLKAPRELESLLRWNPEFWTVSDLVQALKTSIQKGDLDAFDLLATEILNNKKKCNFLHLCQDLFNFALKDLQWLKKLDNKGLFEEEGMSSWMEGIQETAAAQGKAEYVQWLASKGIFAPKTFAHAVRGKCWELAAWLYKAKFPLEPIDERSLPPFFYILSNPQSPRELVETLHEGGFDPRAIAETRWGNRSYFLQVVANHPYLIERYLLAGADPNSSEKGNRFFTFITPDKNPHEFRQIVEAGGKIDSADEEISALNIYIANRNFEAVKALLRDYHPDLNARSKEGWTPLTLLANVPSESLPEAIDLIDQLLAKGATLDQEGSNNDLLDAQPIHFAAHADSLEMVVALEKRGADLSKETAHGLSVLDVAALTWRGKRVLNYLLEEKKFTVVRIPAGANEGVVRQLWNRGASLQAVADWAVTKDCVALVIETAEKGAQVFAPDPEGSSFLHTTYKNELIEFAQNQGMDLAAVNNDGIDAVTMQLRKENRPVAKKIREYLPSELWKWEWTQAALITELFYHIRETHPVYARTEGIPPKFPEENLREYLTEEKKEVVLLQYGLTKHDPFKKIWESFYDRLNAVWAQPINAQLLERADRVYEALRHKNRSKPHQSGLKAASRTLPGIFSHEAHSSWKKATELLSSWAASDEPLTEDFLATVNSTMQLCNKPLREFDTWPGDDVAHLYPPVEQLPQQRAAFYVWVNKELALCKKGVSNPIVVGTLARQKIFSLHCFSNANGRSSLGTMNAIFERFGLPQIALTKSDLRGNYGALTIKQNCTPTEAVLCVVKRFEQLLAIGLQPA